MKTRVVFLFFVVFTLFLSNGLTGQTKLVSGQSGKEPGKKIAPQTVGVDKQKKNQHAPEQFRNLWKTVDSLADLGQPKTALEIVNTIVIRTKNDNNYPQFLKAILYRIRLNSDFQEDFLNQTITDLHSELQQAGEPVASVLHSILAEVYWKYYQNNAWRLRDRTRSEMMKSDSLATWDLNSLIAAIANEYLLSLANPAVTQAIPIESYTAILEIQKKNDGNSKKTDERKARQDNQTWSLLNPTLFDFLSRRALDFFSSGEQLKNQPSDIFVLDNPGFFSPSSQFINFLSGPVLLPDHCYPADSISKDYFAFRIYQNVAAFHLPDKNPAALIDAELNRLEFMKNKAIGLNADSLYQTALHQLDKDYSTFPYSAEISYQLANWLNTQGQLYHPLESENHRRDIGIAAGICDTAIKRHPATAGAKKCSMLLKSIHEPSLQITCESAVTSEKPFLALLGFKNLNLLYFRIVKADPETFNEKSTGMERKIFYHYLRDLELVKSWSLNLPGENDFQQHNTEIVIPEVPSGFYVLICSQDERFIESELTTYAFTPFWSTRISYVSKHNEYGNLDYFFLDRDTGIPLENIKAEVWTKQYDYNTRKYRTSRLYELISGPQGFISIPAPENNTRGTNLFLKIRNNDDFLITDNFYQHPVTHAPERTYQQTMFYTDRAIYRPGQTIYFKGIILEKTGDKSKIRGGQGTTVNFQDVNSQIVSKLTFTSNDFGSFNGSFTAPLGVLPGQMTISNESGSVSISVEEYKRPSFEVVFLPLEKNYKLGESITLAGKAAAYAGNLIDGASVKYRVVRTARFPYHDWGWYRPGPSSSEVEIKNGVAQTGTDGKFTITFKAIPDLTVDQDSKPVFDYRIYADVTDISGETQSILQTVSVGYQSLLIGIDLPELLNLSGDSLFKITTTNLNGFRTPADIKITLRRLTQPDRTFKPRLWERPDLLSISRSAFYSLFPDDIYGDENNPATWSASDTLFEKTLSTATDSI
ncbi:MAG: MG2 domain-containing protein, partial [Bacteroidota bacterium]